MKRLDFCQAVCARTVKAARVKTWLRQAVGAALVALINLTVQKKHRLAACAGVIEKAEKKNRAKRRRLAALKHAAQKAEPLLQRAMANGSGRNRENDRSIRFLLFFCFSGQAGPSLEKLPLPVLQTGYHAGKPFFDYRTHTT
ncbi:hypothetical protein M655_020165 [Brevibacillus sp. NSP2.1]|uniref:hypothetical protein n=1 Tax=Brevibacillus sp. NSP2.1 TaxID=3003229 RepID=UPI00047D5120|nr:hypothetical protein [Brevibacillus sp. NSP2.1]QHZ57782.1 hypothetical protein M655_020165 [Brevibacillus sp. NSP2.1]